MKSTYCFLLLCFFVIIYPVNAGNFSPSLHETWLALLAKQWHLKKIFVDTMEGQEIEVNEFGRFCYPKHRYNNLIEAYKQFDHSDDKIEKLHKKSQVYDYTWTMHSPELIAYFTDSFLEEKFWLYFQLFYREPERRTEIINAAINYIEEHNRLSTLHIWHVAETLHLFLVEEGKLSSFEYRQIVLKNEFLSSLQVNWDVSTGSIGLQRIFSQLMPTNLIFADAPVFTISLKGNKKDKEDAIIQYMHTINILGYCKGFAGFFDWSRELKKTFFDQIYAAGYQFPVHEIPYLEENYKMTLSLAAWGVISGHLLINEKIVAEKAANEIIEYTKTKEKLDKYLKYTGVTKNSPYQKLNCEDLIDITRMVRLKIFESFFTTDQRKKILMEAIQEYSGNNLEDDIALVESIKQEIEKEQTRQDELRKSLLRKKTKVVSTKDVSRKKKNPLPIASIRSRSFATISPEDVIPPGPKGVKHTAPTKKKRKKHPKSVTTNHTMKSSVDGGYELTPPAIESDHTIIKRMARNERKKRKMLEKLPPPLLEETKQNLVVPKHKETLPTKFSIKKIIKNIIRRPSFSSITLWDYFPQNFLSLFQTAYQQQEQKNSQARPKLLKQHPQKDASRYLGESERALKTLYEDRLELLKLTRMMSDRRTCRQKFLSQLGLDQTISDDETKKRIELWQHHIRHKIDDNIREHIRRVNMLLSSDRLDQSSFGIVYNEMNIANGLFYNFANLCEYSNEVQLIREQFLSQEQLIEEYYAKLNDMLLNSENKYSTHEINSLYAQKWQKIDRVTEQFQVIFSDESQVFGMLQNTLRDLEESIVRLDTLANTLSE